MIGSFSALRAVAAAALLPLAAWAKEYPSPVRQGPEGKLVYEIAENGDRVPDFSHAGYGGGGVAVPHFAARVQVTPVDGDDGARLQAAIDFVSSLPPDADGVRGAVLLMPGRYEIAGQLKIRASGVVVRGSGREPDGTVLVATGTDRRPLIELAAHDVRRTLREAVPIADPYVPVGSHRVTIADIAGFAVGQRVTVERPSPEEWIADIGMLESPARQGYSWRPGAFNVRWDRTIVSIEGSTLTLDAPLTTALEARYGGGTVQPYEQEGYIHHVGVENLRCESTYDRANPHDEQHAWNAIDLHAVRDGWVSDVTGVHFAGSVVQVGAKVERVTIQDCAALAPVSELAGYRRLAFHSRGQQVLFLRCTTEFGGNDFSVGYLAAGPNVFLNCVARETSGFSGSIGSWASGLLIDNVSIDGGALRLDNLETWNQGVGWNAANSVVWGSEAATIISRRPPGAHNWAVGVWGQYIGDGRWTSTNSFPRPRSLYRAQLEERLGKESLVALEQRRFTEQTFAAVPALAEAVPDLAARLTPESPPPGQPLTLRDGILYVGDKVLAGKQTAGAWWLGRLEPARAGSYGPALTRFSPGRTGPGLTDEIPSVAAAMEREGQVAFRHHYGLWHDRRRIDHQMIRRPDADVWPPFYEQPFARTGRGRAWDGLSLYDLTKYNAWYFARLRAFAAEARQRGLVLINEMYFQHNILESAAHWVDSPWRPVNNVNDTGFTEPPPYTGDTIKMAAEFYDVTHPVRRELHRAYIRHCLESLAGEPNVIHTLTAENSGPLHFMQFWLDVIAEWMRDTGHDPLIALSAPKDVQEAILADAERAPLIDVIDLTYWYRTPNGAEFAPPGGTDLAPRQHGRQSRAGRTNAETIAATAREYREKFPRKAVISGLEQAGNIQPGL